MPSEMTDGDRSGGGAGARCIAVLGAPHVGKSTLVDRLATLDGGPTPPPAAEGDLRAVRFHYLGDEWTVLDCPGGPECLQDGLDALLAADAAVIVVSPDPDEAVLAAPALRAAHEAHVPTFLFVNRMDEARARVRDIASALQTYADTPVILRQIPLRDGDQVTGAVDLISERAFAYRDSGPSQLVPLPAADADREHEARESLLETLSEFDDWLLEQIVEDKAPEEGPLYAIAARVLQEERATPALIGAAAKGHGARRLMKALRHETPGPEAARARLSAAAGGAPVAAAAFHGRHRKHVGKSVWLRAFVDGLKPGATLGGGGVGVLADATAEKPASVGQLAPGEIAAAIKSDHLRRGALYGTAAEIPSPSWRGPLSPQLVRRIRPRREKDDAKLSEALTKLAEDDPAIRVAQEPGSGALLIEAQGQLHLSRAQETLAEVFGVETEIAPAAAHYRETITKSAQSHYRHKKQSGGSGQFADVTLTVAPGERGQGFRFSETVKGGAVPRNHIPAVEAGARDALAAGPLGMPVVDVTVTLTDGQAHSVDSSDLAFRIAGRSAVAQALADAAPMLLEPIHSVAITAPAGHAGALAQIVGQHRGQVLGFDRDEAARGWEIFRALLPGAALAELSRELRAATQGVARFEHRFDHDQELFGREAEAIVKARAEETAAGRR